MQDQKLDLEQLFCSCLIVVSWCIVGKVWFVSDMRFRKVGCWKHSFPSVWSSSLFVYLVCEGNHLLTLNPHASRISTHCFVLHYNFYEINSSHYCHNNGEYSCYPVSLWFVLVTSCFSDRYSSILGCGGGGMIMVCVCELTVEKPPLP